MTAQEFFAKFDISGGPDACHPWTEYIMYKGYGWVSTGLAKELGTASRRTHKMVWELLNGPVPLGIYVCHKCDNRACGNVSHLFLGTAQENNDDMLAKGRANRTGTKSPRPGESNGNSRLTAPEVYAIRAAFVPGIGSPTNLPRLAEQYGTSVGAIHGIVTRTTWKHLPELESIDA